MRRTHADLEIEGLAALAGAVERLAIGESAIVMDGHLHRMRTTSDHNAIVCSTTPSPVARHIWRIRDQAASITDSRLSVAHLVALFGKVLSVALCDGLQFQHAAHSV